MSSFVFVTIDAGGNVPPAIDIGLELLARGHRVRFLGHERQRSVLTEAGFEFSPFRPMPYWDPSQAQPSHRSLASFVHLCTDQGLGKDLLHRLGEDPADLVIVDCLLLSVLQAMQGNGQDHAVLFHTFYRFWDRNFATGAVGVLARLKGVNARSLWAGATLELVATDPELDPDGHRTNSKRVWCGVVGQAPLDADKEPRDPTVLVSLSTLWLPGQEDAYRRILMAMEGVPLKAVFTTGRGVDPERLVAPPNVSVHAYAPHAEIMPRVDAVIGHGGHSTTMSALAHGLPLLLMPMHPLIDQPMVSQAVADAGAGIRLSKKASSETIRRALMELTGTESFAATARKLGARFGERPGAAVAADRLLATLNGASKAA